jgi:uncharacterized protein (DUF4415 family)
MTDEEIDTSDIPPLDEDFFNNATLWLPKNQATITLKIDSEVLNWFKSQTEEYQERINMVLRFYMESRKKKVG